MSKGEKCQYLVTKGKVGSQKIIEIPLSHMWFEFQGKNIEFKVTNNFLCQSFRRKLFRHWYWEKWLLSKYTEHFSTEIKIQLFKLSEEMFFPIFHLHCTLLLCLKIFYTPSFTSSTVVIAPPSFSQHGIWLNLEVNIFQVKIFLSQISSKFSMWNWHPKFYLKQEETVLEFPKRVDIGMWLYTKKKVNEWMNEWISFGSSAGMSSFSLEQAC